MLNCMLHEPSYSTGQYGNDRLRCHIGWASHRDSFSDGMPVWNRSRDVALIFSGEDFTDADETRLGPGGGDDAPLKAAYLVQLYEKMGLDFVAKLNGWFSGVVVDLRRQRVVVFNDRYGLNRIYYHHGPAGFYFASEAKSLLKILPGLRRLDPRGVAETFSCGSVLQDRTLFSGISLLPAASRWIFTPDGNIAKEHYFSPASWEKQPALAAPEFHVKLKETFARILPRYFRGRRQVAMSLTGGLDGRLIMAWANRPAGGLPCYTFGGTYRDCSDVRIARRIANLCRQPHATIVAGAEFLSQFPALAEKAVFVSDGSMDVTGSVELYVNRKARRIAPIRVTGNYGSEILRANVAFRPRAMDTSWLQPEFASLVQSAVATYRAERNCPTLSFIAFKQTPWHHYARLSVEQSQLTLRSPYLDNDLVALMYRAPQEALASKDSLLRLILDGNPALAKVSTDRGLVYRPAPIIGELRRAYQEAGVRAEYMYDYGMPQWLAAIDHLLAPLQLERLFLGRHKFYHFRVWYRDQLRRYVEEILLDPRTLQRGYFRSRQLEGMIRAHIGGCRNFTSEIHRALTLELTHRQLIEAGS